MGGITWRRALERSMYVPTRKLLLALEYNGFAFRGSQSDAALELKEMRKIKTLSKPSVEAALKRAYSEKSQGSELQHVAFATRTESGVSAIFNVAEVTIARKVTEDTVVQDIIYPMNMYCMSNFQMRILAAACIPDEFSTARSATSRTVRHTIRVVPSYNSYSLDNYKNCWYHVSKKRLDVEKMDVVAKAVFAGRHALSSFTTETYVQSLATTVCKVYDISVTEEDTRSGQYMTYGESQLIHIDITCDHFLPRQVERTATALVSVGRDETTGEELIEQRNAVNPLLYSNHRYTAPRHGSCVTHIGFPEGEVTWIFPERGLNFSDSKDGTIEMAGSHSKADMYRIQEDDEDDDKNIQY
ncbi:tRNA pseudouridine synthase A-like [Sycon ciliatum]|uniref:tRNA pseudouridine synthase A-like n=1 Tax=Sycon ciliatum TaxID=27933 RepID=UPI0020ADA3DF|eukprot:scpid84315/ scgid15835/ tRNA pseudouridine synthase A; tRNA pseudouridine(38-40) synthase; tRNA pseudouridylate synthase I; tRNA-uridine isomerase I &gt; tRNA pseudouridine synthase A; tRNA pseudouridine(38-40) synthase; tRNA pseudouridylate synthase I; tRNA-uridine isomerase I